MFEIPADTRQFLIHHFDSVEAVEIVSLLRRSDTAFWTEQAVSQQLRISESVARNKLSALAASRILVRGEQTGAYRFAPQSDELLRGTEDVLRCYSEQKSDVVQTIYTANLEKLRAFSDAFRLKKD